MTSNKVTLEVSKTNVRACLLKEGVGASLSLCSDLIGYDSLLYDFIKTEKTVTSSDDTVVVIYYIEKVNM